MNDIPSAVDSGRSDGWDLVSAVRLLLERDEKYREYSGSFPGLMNMLGDAIHRAAAVAILEARAKESDWHATYKTDYDEKRARAEMLRTAAREVLEATR